MYEWPELLADVPYAGTFHSPLMLCQEAVGGFDNDDRAWRVVLGSMMCVRTHRRQSHPTLWRFLSEWPDSTSVAFGSDDRRMAAILRPCGFHNRRTDAVVRMSKNWVMGLRPPETFGSGQYVTDAYRIFVLGELNFAPNDGELAKYVGWRLAHGTR